ncbi:hypothetical protein FQN54_003866 [Arachnomyces sp. PD_36]|nr:hypothetical protein FQN54_003866 [Arachnomyces sp. PD_36]
MAPIRRYLRITKYSVLECRIYLNNPADTRWLLDPKDKVLSRIFERIRPHVLPKLREENERVRAKKKSNPLKDVISEDEYEVAVFLQETGSRHSILTKNKAFGGQKKISSNSNKLTGESGSPILVDDHNEEPGAEILVESDDEPHANLKDIPEAALADEEGGRPKRRRRTRGTVDNREPKSSSPAPNPKRKKTVEPLELSSEEDLDEKKLGLATTYEGFSILGWMLCLLITKKGGKARNPSDGSGGQVLMEEWISTQAQGDNYEDD